MDQPGKFAKPVHGQLNRENKFPCKSIRGKYIYIYCCLHFFICQVYFLVGYMYIRARFTSAYAPVLSTCPLRANSGCGKDRRTLTGPW